MTAEFITALAALIAIAISFRSASFTELRGLFETLKGDFEKYKKEASDKEKEYEAKIESLERQIDNYERWITAAIDEIRKLGGTPPPMERYDR
jgi:peptidoglycan hydrolase CwlO-like protein